MGNQPQLDDQYKSGVWYDIEGDFCKIQESDNGDTVELVNPETDSVYWDVPVTVWNEGVQDEFTRVPPEAVDDPVNYINNAIRRLLRNDPEELMSTSVEEAEVGVRWARQQVSIELE
jgi:hypothetical protein